MTKQLSFNENVVAIYSLANSPASLYYMLRDYLLQQEDIMSLSTQVLKDEFETRSNNSITNSQELAEAYAVLVALTLKPQSQETDEYLRSLQEKIKFEWFSKIIQIYFESREIISFQKVIIDTPTFGEGLVVDSEISISS